MSDDESKALEEFSQGLKSSISEPIQTHSERLSGRDADLIAKAQSFLGRLAEAATKQTGVEWEIRFGTTTVDPGSEDSRFMAFPIRSGVQKMPFRVRFYPSQVAIEATDFDNSSRSDDAVYQLLARVFKRCVVSAG